MTISGTTMVDFSKIKTYPLRDRKNLESVDQFVSLSAAYTPCDDPNLARVADAIKQARARQRQVIVMFGGHVIKVGMSLFLIDLIRRGFIQHLATNGAGSIHDFEIALIGETSEDVGDSIETGRFGMAEETGAMMNEAIRHASRGYGEAIGRMISEKKMPHREQSIFHAAYAAGIPITVHVAIGTDIIHQHPTCDGAALGKASYQDFQIFTESVSKLEGGVILNIGSAVVLPEVFLKALSICRNLGYPVQHFTAATLDMIKHYRPLVNVVERPTVHGGAGYYIVGRHEQTIPTLYHQLV
jgi:deoxyhypusine synthase